MIEAHHNAADRYVRILLSTSTIATARRRSIAIYWQHAASAMAGRQRAF